MEHLLIGQLGKLVHITKEDGTHVIGVLGITEDFVFVRTVEAEDHFECELFPISIVKQIILLE